MSDEPRHNSSIELDEKIKRTLEAGEILPPALIGFMVTAGGPNFESWVNTALREAQEDKEIFLGRRPPRVIKQPDVAISNWQHIWQTSHMNNKREIGPGDVKKK